MYPGLPSRFVYFLFIINPARSSIVLCFNVFYSLFVSSLEKEIQDRYLDTVLKGNKDGLKVKKIILIMPWSLSVISSAFNIYLRFSYQSETQIADRRSTEKETHGIPRRCCSCRNHEGKRKSSMIFSLLTRKPEILVCVMMLREFGFDVAGRTRVLDQ